jgi:hypothetical protein
MFMSNEEQERSELEREVNAVLSLIISNHPERERIEVLAEWSRKQDRPGVDLEPAEEGWYYVTIFHPDQQKRVRIGRLKNLWSGRLAEPGQLSFEPEALSED